MQPSLGKREEPMENLTSSNENGSEAMSSGKEEEEEANEKASDFSKNEETQKREGSPSFVSTKVIIRDSEG